MTPSSELDRLFTEVFPPIPKPDALESTSVMRVTRDGDKFRIEPIPMRRVYLDPIDADETNYGVCAQGESDEQ
ncbi:hypothetical protein [Stenotrophomonas sp. AB1(2024)]|uniref:hypothetical protein n=1 Tax=Stenotrophomonas sp. AB1(2024) TaxID=3132215 RepID=UPI0030AE1C46